MSATDLLTALIKCASFTPRNPERPQDYAACLQTLDILEAHARNSGATLLQRLEFEGAPALFKVPCLIVRWHKGTATQTLLYSGHTDVVGVTESEWSTPPFAAEVKDGFLYGRGTTDMKGANAAWFTSVPQALEGLDNYDIFAVITCDEEWTGAGAYLSFEWLKAQGHTPTSVLVGEPSSLDVIADSIRFGRRGSLSGILNATGISGHVAYPANFLNPITHITRAKTALLNVVFQSDGKGTETTNLEFTYESAGSAAEGGTVPATAEAKFNIRFTANYTVPQLESMLHAALKSAEVDPAIVKLTLFTQSAAVPYTSTPGKLTEAILQTTGTNQSVLNRSGGTSDGRHVHSFFPQAEVIEFGPPSRGGKPDTEDPTYGEKGGIHQIDERIKLTDLTAITDIYTKVIRTYFSA